ncbi:MAG: hypothetical protein E7554_07060 [Ruminococcaceae bacterium]|nr:hypothetical protein [Oscillospiraceae bacterium]
MSKKSNRSGGLGSVLGKVRSFLSETWSDLRQGMKTNRFRRGSTAAMITALAICIAVLLNIVAIALTEKFTFFSPDLTKNHIYSLSDVTVDLLENLDVRVEIDILASEANCEYVSVSDDPYGHIPMATELIRRYEQYSDNIRVEFIDLNTDPWFLDLIPDYRDAVGDYSIVVRSEYRTRVTSFYEMLPSLSGSVETESSGIDLASSLTECVLSSLIKTVSMEVNPSVAYIDALMGGSEVDNLLNALEINGYDILYSADFAFGYDPIPQEADMVIIAAPQYDVTAAGLDQLSDFLNNGGNYGKTVLILTSPYMQDMPNLSTLTEEWGIVLTRNVVHEGDPASVVPTQSDDMFYSTYYSAEYIDSDITNEYAPVAGAVELQVPRDSFGGFAVNTILSSSAQGYSVNPQGERSQPGYHSIMAQSTFHAQSEDGQSLRSDLIVAPVALCADEFFSSKAYSNFDLMMRICNERCGITDETLNISAVSLTAVDFSIESGEVAALTVIFGYVVPIALAVLGLAVYLRRRRL